MNALKIRAGGNVSARQKKGVSSASSSVTSGSKGGRLETLKNLSNKSAKKRVFGERCFDYITACRHQLTRRPGTEDKIPVDPNYVFCPYCRLINSSLKAFYNKENHDKKIAREESLKNRSILRTKLLYQWSQSQSFHYQHMEIDMCIDVIWSISLADSIIMNDCLLELIDKKTKKSNFWFHSPSSTGLPPILTGSEDTLPIIDFDEMMNILRRNKRINEVGHLAAILIQSHLRKYLTKRRLRYILLKRFEYVPSTRTQYEYYYDTKTLKKWNYQPRLIQSERPATPRTIERRLNFEKKNIQKKLDNYNNYMKLYHNQYEKNSFYQLYHHNFMIRDIKIIQYLKQLIIVRDLLMTVINQLNEMDRLKQQKKLDEEKQASSIDLLSHLPSSKSLNNKSMHFKEGLAAEAPETPRHTSKPIWLVPTAPGLPSRQLGLAIALATTPSPNRAITPGVGLKSEDREGTAPLSARASISRSASVSTPSGVGRNSILVTTGKAPPTAGGGPVSVLTPTQRALQMLEQAVWESLICHSAEEIIQKLLIKDLIPIYESVMNFAQDEFGIWNSNYSKIQPTSTVPADNSAISANSSFSNLSFRTSSVNNLTTALSTPKLLKEDEEAKWETIPEDNENMKRPDTANAANDDNSYAETPNPEVLPFGFQMRVASHGTDIAANGFFRLFFYDEELIAISASSPWVYYPEVYRNKEGILSSINRFLNHSQIRTLIHQIYRTANKTHQKYQQLQHHGSAASINSQDTGKRKQSVVSLSSKRKSSVTPNPVNTNKQATSAAPLKPENYVSLFLPSETMIFAQARPSTAQGAMGSPIAESPNRATIMGMDKPAVYDESVIQDLNSLTDEQILYIHEKYKFAKKLKPFQEKHKRVLQNLLRRKEKEEKEKKEKKKKQEEDLFLEDLENEVDLEEKGKKQLLEVKSEPATPIPIPNGPAGRRGSKGGGPPAPITILDKLTWKKSFDEMHREFKGKDLYELYADPVGSKRKEEEKRQKEVLKSENRSDNTYVEEKPKENDYVEKLFEAAVDVDSKMSNRIHAPPGLIENYPVAQLLVMDVYLTLPKPNKSDLAGGAARRNSLMGGYGANPLSFPVEIHQVVGIFPCESEKCPANLDCGLFDYDFFHNVYIRQKEAEENKNMKDDMSDVQSTKSMSSASKSRSAAMSTHHNDQHLNESNNYILRDKDWSPPHAKSGISVGRSALASGREFQYQLLGQWPSREYLESNLPRKVRGWLGLPT